MNEKQKAKLLYDIREKQFRNYYLKAVRRKGNTEQFLVQELESRLDNVIFRMGFAKTRQQARQLVSHKFFAVNGKGVNIRSFEVRPGDEVSLRDTKTNKGLIAELKEYAGQRTIPSWLSTNPSVLSGRMLSVPEGEDLSGIFDPKLIIEFYSR